MKINYKHSISLILLLLTTAVSAQYIQVDDTYTAQQLTDALLANSCSQVSNVVVTGSPNGRTSYGYFNAASSNFPFADGIFLSTGYATSVPGPNRRNDDLSDGEQTWEGDRDLQNALDSGRTYNATVLEFDFVPLTTSISFDYMLASEEYLQQVPFLEYCDYSDGFAFLLKPAGTNRPYQNLAVIPNTDIPVKVTTVRGPGMCPVANEQYFGGYNGTISPTAFNGQTVVLTAKADVTPGVAYHIKLVIADQGDTMYDSAIFLGGGSFNFSIDLGEDRELSSSNPVCDGETVTLTSMAGADSYKWYKDGIEQPATRGTFIATGPGEYKTEATFSTCVYSGTVNLEYAPAISQAPVTFVQCDDNNDGLTAYYLSQITEELFTDPDASVTDYFLTTTDAAANTNALPTDTPFYNTVRNQEIYVVLENQYGCTATVPLTLSINTPDGIVLTPLENCETEGVGSGLAEFDLAAASADILTLFPAGTTLNYYTTYNNALALTNEITATYINITPRLETIYVRINSTQGCFGIKPLDLIVHSFVGNFEDQEVILCQNTTQMLDAGSGFDSYSWNTTPPVLTRLLTIDEPGTYSVTVENSFGCEAVKTFIVTPSGPAITAKFDISDFADNNNTVTVSVLQGIGTYQYSLDGDSYQDEPVFNNVASGSHIVYIKDINGCGPVYQKTIYVLDYPRVFTPNGDGINDTWLIPYMYTRPALSVNIFNRYGKLITAFNGGNSTGWDGRLNGSPLPADDYWFTIQLENGNIIKGHFSLMR
ncbi:T9SS type B sorting domain-containing protein [Flavobacterium sp. Sd200]|uniref:T9SS type B sorting domain-containing protein n=1 Tax=Flavobacterium sp. Sd200 TaxID=2692211 RepID=UPI001370D352|nr:choice-of-anchor L domain-containing protein [Flavobacterium sp. Sd200]MXN92930.1 T9SS type B sorting domain-containing protein [Flavobacterium sp. Sd200]